MLSEVELGEMVFLNLDVLEFGDRNGGVEVIFSEQLCLMFGRKSWSDVGLVFETNVVEFGDNCDGVEVIFSVFLNLYVLDFGDRNVDSQNPCLKGSLDLVFETFMIGRGSAGF